MFMKVLFIILLIVLTIVSICSLMVTIPYFLLKFYDILLEFRIRLNPNEHLIKNEKYSLNVYLKHKEIMSYKRKIRKKPYFTSLFLFMIFKNERNLSEVIEEFEKYRSGEENIPMVKDYLEKESKVKNNKIDENKKYSDCYDRFKAEKKSFIMEFINRYVHENYVTKGFITEEVYNKKFLSSNFTNLLDAHEIIKKYVHIEYKEFYKDILRKYNEEVNKERIELNLKPYEDLGEMK